MAGIIIVFFGGALTSSVLNFTLGGGFKTLILILDDAAEGEKEFAPSAADYS